MTEDQALAACLGIVAWWCVGFAVVEWRAKAKKKPSLTPKYLLDKSKPEADGMPDALVALSVAFVWVLGITIWPYLLLMSLRKKKKGDTR